MKVALPRVVLLAVAAPVAALAACASAHPGHGLALGAPSRLPTSSRSHLAIIVMENEEATGVIGSPQAPYLNRLAHRYALATNYYGVSHPSLPNYLALTGGSTFGIVSDCTSCSVRASNLADQLQSAGVSWRAYMEGLPRPCDSTPGVDGYAKKHDPFLYYRDVASNPGRCRSVVPYGRLGSDLRTGRLPTFVWITPNLCDDGHDCPLPQADRYLAATVPALLRELGPRGLLFIVWDEGSTSRGCCAGQADGGRVAAIAAGPGARRGVVSALPYDHYSLLRTVEDLLRLAHLRLAGSPATTPLTALLTGATPLR